ncbi:MAG TPA: extracellular solute-binding protein [Thermomicrobiales bacterium]|nr:extracellular solute-binding protein [Thermomicrobiales bacterium]
MDKNMLAKQHQVARDLVDQYLNGKLDRRDILKRAGMLGLSVPALSAALAARGVMAQEASPEASAGASPMAEEAPLQLGDYSGKKLRISIAMAESEAEVFKNVVVSAFKDQTGGDVEVVNIEAADVVRTLQAQVGSGNIQLDLLVQDNNTLAPLVSGDLVEEIPDAEQIMPPQTIDRLKPVLQFDDKYYFLPARPNVQITYYNDTKFKDYGVETPTTWDDLSATAKTIKEKAGVGQVSIQGVAGGPVGVTVTQFLWQAGGDPLDINTDAGQQAFQFLQDLKPDLTPQYPTATFDTTNTYILNQSVVLAQNWPFGVNVIVEEGGMKDVLVYPGWTGPSGNNVLVLGGDVFGIAKGTPNKDMALDFTRLWMSRDIQEALTAQNGWPSMRSDALGEVADWQQPYFQVVNDAMALSQARPNVTYWGDIETILTNAFNDIVSSDAGVADTLKKYQDEIDKAKNG